MPEISPLAIVPVVVARDSRMSALRATLTGLLALFPGGEDAFAEYERLLMDRVQREPRPRRLSHRPKRFL